MAQMIPNHPPFSPSPGEKELYEALKDAPGTEDWLVFHSLNLAEHVSQAEGEADALIIVPEKGILVLEVKGCKHLYRTDRAWYYGTNPAPDYHGPFKQASDAMHSIRSHLLKLCPESKEVIFCSGVLFTRVERSGIDAGGAIEWHDWQLIDGKEFLTQAIDKLLVSIIHSQRTHLSEKLNTKGILASKRPDKSECEKIKEALSCSFEFTESPRIRAIRREKELIKRTEQQLRALDAVKKNPRVVFEGPAGTGKTFLAIEAARRFAEDGKKVFLCCYNKLLGGSLASEIEDISDCVDASTLHHIMRLRAQISDQEIAAKASSQEFWSKELPEQAITNLLEQNSEDQLYDRLIIDEAQDFWCEAWLDFLDLSLKNGLKDGHWMMFGDFDRQGIFGTPTANLETTLENRSISMPAFHTLSTNCRNVKSIARFAEKLSGVDLYASIRRDDEGEEPVIKFYDDDKEQETLLIKTLEELAKKGYSGRDVVILSRKSASRCIAGKISEPPWKDRLKTFGNEGRGGYVRYGSIHAFKGMEAKAVIVTDLDKFDAANSQSLLYVAVTRAQEQLVLLCHKSQKGAFEGLNS